MKALRTLLVLVLAVTIIFFGPSSAFAANTHSIDLELDSEQYLTASDSGSLSVQGDLTLEAYVKFETVNTANTIISKKNNTGASDDFESYSMIATKAGANTIVEFRGSTGNTTPVSTNLDWLTGSYPNTGQWYHIAVTRNKAGGEVKLYVDGTLKDTNTGFTTSNLFNSTGQLHIGAYKVPGQTDFFDGLVDEVRIWSAVRTGTEINDNKNTELTGSESGLNAYWKLNNALTDSTANANTLSNVGSAVFSTDVPFTDAAASSRPAAMLVGMTF